MDFLSSFTTAVLENAWHTFVTAAPFLLLGLVLAGAVHILLPDRLVSRFLSGGGSSGVLRAAAIGVPIPICSCGIVPLAIEADRKGSSRPATMALLITTPESSPDAILLTWSLLGPVMAIVRPLASVINALAAAAAASLAGVDGSQKSAPSGASSSNGCAVDGDTRAETPGARLIAALRYGLVELVDDLALWLVIGFLGAGLITTAVPLDLAARYDLGDGLLPMLLVLAASVPLYLCASASTPVAAALVASGFSPGAALVLMLAGPATNVASLVPLTGAFGRRFVAVYVASVALGSLLAGLAFDFGLELTDHQIIVRLIDNGHESSSLVAAFALAGLLIVSLARKLRRSTAASLV